MCARHQQNIICIHKSTFEYVHDTPDEVRPINFAYKFPSFRRNVEMAVSMKEEEEEEKKRQTYRCFFPYAFIYWSTIRTHNTFCDDNNSLPINLCHFCIVQQVNGLPNI